MKSKFTFLIIVVFGICNFASAQTTITLQPDSACGKDAIIGDCVPCGYYNSNFGAADEFAGIAWTNGGNPSNERGLLQFDLSAIPTTATVTSAKLSLYWNPNPASGNTGHSQISGSDACWLQRITSAWTEFGVTWANQPSTTTINEVALPASTSNNQDYPNIDVTALVQDMVNNPSQSFGFMLMLQTETYYRSLLFASSDHANAALHPKLEVTYVDTAPTACLTLQPGPCTGNDAVINNCVPCGYYSSNYGSSDELGAIAWTNGGNVSTERGVLQFDLGAIPNTATVTGALLSLYWNPNPASGNPGHSQLSGANDAWLQRITSAWTEYGVSWANQPTTTTQNEVALAASTSNNQDYPNIDVTALVQDMVSNPSQSFGFMLMLQNETYYRSLLFASSDYPDATLRPKLEVCYTNSAPPVSYFQSSDTTFCTEGSKCIGFTDLSTGNPTGWKWYFPGANPDSSIQQNPTSICYFSAGTYAVTLIVTNAAGSDTLNVSPMITFANAPATPALTINGGDTIICSHACSYQWYFNGAIIPGAIDSFYVATQNGTYSTRISDCIGCNVLSNGITFPMSIAELNNTLQIKIYPNPLTSSSVLQFNATLTDAEVVVYDMVGKELLRKKLTGNKMEIERGSLESGVYFVKVVSEDKQWVEKIVVE